MDEVTIDGTELLAWEREERILCILEVKKSKNVLHCVIGCGVVKFEV